MAEVIEVQIIADDSGLTSAFNNIADQAEEISSAAGDIGDNIEKNFNPKPLHYGLSSYNYGFFIRFILSVYFFWFFLGFYFFLSLKILILS